MNPWTCRHVILKFESSLHIMVGNWQFFEKSSFHLVEPIKQCKTLKVAFQPWRIPRNLINFLMTFTSLAFLCISELKFLVCSWDLLSWKRFFNHKIFAREEWAWSKNVNDKTIQEKWKSYVPKIKNEGGIIYYSLDKCNETIVK